MPDFRQQQGAICEHILTEYLLREGYFVMRPLSAQGPIDVIAYNENGDMYFLDAKQNATRIQSGRKTPQRIHRILTTTQKLLNVRIAYIDIETRDVHIVPPFGE